MSDLTLEAADEQDLADLLCGLTAIGQYLNSAGMNDDTERIRLLRRRLIRENEALSEDMLDAEPITSGVDPETNEVTQIRPTDDGGHEWEAVEFVGTTSIPCGCGEYYVDIPNGDTPPAIDVVCPVCGNHFGHDQPDPDEPDFDADEAVRRMNEDVDERNAADFQDEAGGDE